MKPIYLLTSNSYLKMKDAISSIIQDNPYNTYDLLIDELDDIIEEASYVSLFDEQKYMVVKNAYVFGAEKRISKSLQTLLDKDSNLLTPEEREKIKKYENKNKKLIEYIENPNPNTILIFCLYGKSDSKKKITKLIKEKYEFLDFPDSKPKELRSELDKYMKKDGYKLDYNTITYILNSAQNNYDLTMQEAEKIKLFYGKGRTVLLEDIEKIVSKNIEDSNFKFLDAVLEKKLKEAFKIYDDLMLQKTEPIMLLSMIAKEIRNTLLIKQMKNKTRQEIMNFLQIRYDFQLDKMINHSYSFSISQLKEYLHLLSQFDYQIKTGQINNKLALELFILKICQ